MPSLAQVHIDVALTSFSLMYKNPSYVADMVFPIVPVNKRSGKYFIYRKEDFLTPSTIGPTGYISSIRKPGTEAAEIDFQVSNDSYYAQELAYREIVPDGETAIADDPIQPELDAAVQVNEKILLDNETMVASVALKRANYPASNKVVLTTGGTGTSWNSYASVNSNPLLDIKNGKIAVMKGILREANRALFSVDAARTLADHPLIKDLIKYVSSEALTMSGLPKIIRGLLTIEAAQQKNGAVEGLAYSGSNLWVADDLTQAALIYYANPNPSPRSVSMGHTFEAPDDATGMRGVSIRKWYEQKRKGLMVEGSTLRDWKIVSKDAGGLNVGGYLISSSTI